MIRFNPPEENGIEVISYPDFLQHGSSKNYRDKENQPVRKL
jgi:hypothetical protein